MSNGILRDGWKRKLQKLKGGLVLAEISTINDTALYAADLDRETIKKQFVNRTPWTVGSVYPKRGSRAGLIPLTKKTSNGAYVRVGSVQEYMRDQDEGWTEQDPFVPTDKARVSGSHKKKIRRANHMNYIKRKGVMKADKFSGPHTRRGKIQAMLAVSRKEKFKGVLYIKPGDPTTLPAGYYRRKGRALRLIRLEQPGNRRRKATHWHTNAMKDPRLRGLSSVFFNRNAARITRGMS